MKARNESTDLKIRMRKYHREAHDGSYAAALLHEPSGSWRQWWWWFNFQPSKEHDGGLATKALHSTMGLSGGCSDKGRLLRGGDGNYGCSG